MVTSADDSLERASLPILRDAGLALGQWTTAEAARRYPLFSHAAAASSVF
jgi:hypothetical protein